MAVPVKMYGAHSQRMLVLKKVSFEDWDRPNRHYREVNRRYTLNTANTPGFVTFEKVIIGKVRKPRVGRIEF
jgi:hypothetical protein